MFVVASALLATAAASFPVLATDKCGAVCDETWTSANSPYVVTCDVTVAAACALTIEAGAEVRFQTATGLLVDGTLDVNGTSGSEVALTSDATDGLYAYGSGTSATLNQVTATHNTRGIYVYNQATATLTGVTARFNDDGLYVYYGNATRVDATDCTFTDNNRYGVYADGQSRSYHPSVNLSGSSIHSNLGGHDLYAVQYSDPTQYWATGGVRLKRRRSPRGSTISATTPTRRSSTGAAGWTPRAEPRRVT